MQPKIFWVYFLALDFAKKILVHINDKMIKQQTAEVCDATEVDEHYKSWLQNKKATLVTNLPYTNG